MTNRAAKIFLAVLLVAIYLPIITVIAYSFNASPYPTQWTGSSLRWYKELFKDQELIRALFTSLRIATISATIATVLGVCGGVSLVKIRRFRGRALFIGMLSAPFVIPEVVTGFSLLLLCILVKTLMGSTAEHGSLVVILAHATIGMAYVTTIVASRLSTFDVSLEEAAQDLGARPLRVFFLVTLPIVARSVVMGWLLSFTISLDDVVIANFTSGTGTTTLPMLIYSRIKFGITPQVNALAALMILTASLIIVFVCALGIRRRSSDESADSAS